MATTNQFGETTPPATSGIGGRCGVGALDQELVRALDFYRVAGGMAVDVLL